MSLENKKTIEAYQEYAHVYLANSIEHDNLDQERAKEKKKELEDLISLSFSSIPAGAKVFEIGSADGTNAKYIQELGYNITASDTADAFIEATTAQCVPTIKFDALTDDFKEKYFAIFCWRVFVHFTEDDARKIILKAYSALEENGVFIFNAINREAKEVDSEWVDFPGEYHMGVDRFYNYFTKDTLDEIISETDFSIQKFHTEGGKSNNKWLVYVLKK